MKKHGTYALICAALLATLLTGCANKADYDTGVNGNGANAPDPNSGIVTDNNGLIGDVNDRNDLVNRPVTDSTKTDRNALDRAGSAVRNGVDRVGNAIENGVNDLTGNQSTTAR